MKAAVPGSWVRFPPSVGHGPPPCSSDTIRSEGQSSLSGGDFAESDEKPNPLLEYERRFGVQPEQQQPR